MQTMRLICLLLLGFIVAMTYEQSSFEPSIALPESKPGRPSIMQKVSRVAAHGTDQSQQPESSSQKAGTETRLKDQTELEFNPQSGDRSDVDNAISDLRVLARSCVAYRKLRGEFPPSLLALRKLNNSESNRLLNGSRGYRFHYSRRDKAKAFTLNAVPVGPHVSSLPRVWIDESQEIRFERAAMAAR